ncbi:hypothetical protein H2200_007143 [Cladophialophora chaetospira]|uniref:Uncharacterized protein n=1 Tax=Cladophialophora chaetospira TaxID=386627 RepID=A0AA39CHE7_9EURO|nr:hypothetical protein H2200_007143 [Cladophialophora chaetospira]
MTAAQFHYNVPDDDPLNQGNSTGTGAEDGKRDSINAGWCPGSGFIIRTKAWGDHRGPDHQLATPWHRLEDRLDSWEDAAGSAIGLHDNSPESVDNGPSRRGHPLACAAPPDLCEQNLRSPQ